MSNLSPTQPAAGLQAMIFSAGLGTRFKPWTDHHPKALAVVNGRTLLQRNIEYLQQHGVYDVVVNVHHFADQVESALRDNQGWGSRVRISDEREAVLETGGGLLKAESLFIAGQRFLTCNVDILTDLDIGKLLQFHQEQKSLISFGVTSRPSSRELLFDEAFRLSGWRNNSTGEERISRPEARPAGGWIARAYSCVVVFEYEIFRLMRASGFAGKFSLIDVYLALAPGHRIMGYDHSGDRLVDVGRPASVAVAESQFA